MLSSTERTGLLEILKEVPVTDVVQLSETVSCKKVIAENKQEATEIILRYSESSQELLKRKKIHANYIFNYLHKNGVDVPVKSEKKMLIRMAVQFWNGSVVAEYEDEEYEEEDGEMAELEENTPNTSTVALPCDPLISQMSMAFIEWFYKILNSSTGDFSQSNKFGPHHFWEDCTLTLYNNQTESISYTGSLSVAQNLSDLVTKRSLNFDPNITNGVKSTTDPHGLVRILTSGVVYNNLTPCGIFDQGFGLIKTFGMESAWKIKFTELKITVKVNGNVPSLTFDTNNLGNIQVKTENTS